MKSNSMSRGLGLVQSTVILAVLVSVYGCGGTGRSSVEGMYPGFGGYKRPISTRSTEAQQWFNQGIQLLYGFNHDEAIRSFQKASAVDDRCAMAWWGVAYASGLHINNPAMSEKQSKQAYEAAQQAIERIEYASPVEQALIHAVSQRYAWPIPADRNYLDRAYADAMQKVWQEFPNDPDVGAFYAESLMNLQPWDLWTVDGKPKGRTLEIVATLERVIRLRRDHPGANHFYIHAVEASTHPERAIASAERLGSLVPGSGDLVHMPAHIYARVGRWADAADANTKAIAADRAYFALAPEPDFYSLYFIHDLHFLAWAAMMEGRYGVALQAARELQRDIPEKFLRDWTPIADGFMPVGYHVMIRFGKWEEILAEPEPPAYRLVSVAMWRYARGIAFSALGRVSEATHELAAFELAADSIPDDWAVGQNSAVSVMDIALLMLRGELAYRQGRFEESFSSLREAVALEDTLIYDEPPGWMQPVRHALGALLIGAGRADEAAAVYIDDLKRNRRNGWSLLGMERVLVAQGNHREAAKYAAERAKLWTRSDVNPTSSCYCEPGMAAQDGATLPAGG